MRPYSSEEIAVVIPTKDRPESIRELLKSLARQSVPLGRIIVVDSGEPVDYVLVEFASILSVEYYRSLPGQVRQRNFGLSLIGESTPLVATIDDDLIFETDAFAELLAFWNSSREEPGGVGFNHRTAPPSRFSLLRAIFIMSSRKPGSITLSGYNVSIAQLTEDIRSSWLGGGYTVWRLSVLREVEQEEIATRWAIGEDVRVSYAIGKRHKLYVAHRAGFKESSDSSISSDLNSSIYRGYKSAAAYYYFVKRNPELSRLLCVWMLIGRSIAKILTGVYRSRLQDLYYAAGVMRLIVRLPMVELGLISLRKIMEDKEEELKK